MKLLNIKNTRTAVILCGGRGTRLGSVTKKIPKSLVKIKGKPIIWYILKILKKNKFNHFILPAGYKEDKIKKYLKKRIFNNFNIKIVSTGVDTPIAKRICAIRKYIKSENFLLLNGDAVFDFNLDKIFKNHIKDKKTNITFLGSETNLPYGTIVISKGLVKNFERDVMFNAVKISNKQNTIAHVYSGMAILKNKILNKDIQNYKNFEVEFYPKIIKRYVCKFQKFSGFWHSIDNIKDVKILKTDIDKKIKIENLLNKLK
jgi:glucose-1-phosphate cytidylyltransferase